MNTLNTTKETLADKYTTQPSISRLNKAKEILLSEYNFHANIDKKLPELSVEDTDMLKKLLDYAFTTDQLHQRKKSKKPPFTMLRKYTTDLILLHEGFDIQSIQKQDTTLNVSE